MLIKKRNVYITIVVLLIIGAIFAYYTMGDTQQKTVTLHTNKGDIVIALASDMPITTGNFEKLVSQGFYDGTLFHRVIEGFMVQGGDPLTKDASNARRFGTGGPGYVIRDEFTANNRNVRGTISMANAGPNTGGSQFFINLVDNSFLDSKHPVFGKVIKGMEVVDSIASVDTDQNDRPLQDVVIKSAEVSS